MIAVTIKFFVGVQFQRNDHIRIFAYKIFNSLTLNEYSLAYYPRLKNKLIHTKNESSL